jgi:hypothetical protein
MIYYVYQHRKADTNEIFYVGKGKQNRLNHLNGRNNHWKNIVNKHGFVAEKIIERLDEVLALFAEMEIINIYRMRCIKLANITDGGQGLSGYRYTMPNETKRKLSEKAQGRPAFFKKEHFTEQMRMKVIESNKRRKMTDVMKEKMTFKGLHHTQEHKEYIRTKMLGRIFSEETKQKISEGQKKREKFSDATRLKMSIAAKNRSRKEINFIVD